MSDKRSGQRTPVMLRIKLRYPDVDTFVGKFATNVSRGGMFIASRKPKDVGSTIKFELQLADGSPVIGGEGVVRWVREFDENNPRRPHGMGIEFTKLSEQSAAAMDLLAELRKSRGLDENSIPMEEKKKEPEPEPEPEPEEKPEEKPKKRAKRKTKAPEGKKKKRRARRTTKAKAKKRDEEPPTEDPPQEAAAPEPEPEPEPKPQPEPQQQPPPAPVAAPPPPPAASAVPTHVDLADTDRQLAAILETDEAGIAAMILRAREIAFEAGGDSDVDALLRPPDAPTKRSITDASAELSGIVGAKPVAKKRSARGTTPPPPPRARRGPTVPPPIPDDRDGDDEADTFVGLDPDDLIPIPEDEDPITVDEPVGMALDLDDLAHGTPPPPPDLVQDIEPMLEPRGGGDSTVVETSIPDSAPISFTAETTPLPPPVSAEEQEAALGDFTPPPNPADDDLSHELSVDAMDADDLIASGLDELPSGQLDAVDPADEFNEDAPTNIVGGPDGEIPTDVVSGDDDEINAALESLLGDQRRTVGNNTEDITAVRDDTGQGARAATDDGIEIDLGDFDDGGNDDPDDDPDGGKKKKGFFKRMFGKE